MLSGIEGFPVPNEAGYELILELESVFGAVLIGMVGNPVPEAVGPTITVKLENEYGPPVDDRLMLTDGAPILEKGVPNGALTVGTIEYVELGSG